MAGHSFHWHTDIETTFWAERGVTDPLARCQRSTREESRGSEEPSVSGIRLVEFRIVRVADSLLASRYDIHQTRLAMLCATLPARLPARLPADSSMPWSWVCATTVNTYSANHDYSRYNPDTAEIILCDSWRPKDYFQFEIIINVLVSSFWLIWIPMWWVYGHYKNNYFYSAGIDFRRRHLTSTDVRFRVRFRRLKSILAL